MNFDHLFLFIVEDYICVWNRSGHDQEIKTKINQTLKRILNLPSTIILEYKVHSEALKKCNNRTKPNKNMIIATWKNSFLLCD